MNERNQGKGNDTYDYSIGTVSLADQRIGTKNLSKMRVNPINKNIFAIAEVHVKLDSKKGKREFHSARRNHVKKIG